MTQYEQLRRHYFTLSSVLAGVLWPSTGCGDSDRTPSPVECGSHLWLAETVTSIDILVSMIAVAHEPRRTYLLRAVVDNINGRLPSRVKFG
ncbi:hypothetical protein SprV_0301205900 [Sparganum proliferum]